MLNKFDRSHCYTAVGLRSFCIRRNPNPNPNLDHESSGGSHSHTAVGLRSFYIVVSLSLSYSGRAAHILHCRIALIDIQRSGYAHFAFVVSLSFPLNVWLLLNLSKVAGCIPRAVRGSRCRTLQP